MKFPGPTLLLCIAGFARLGAADPTWPSSIDELEDVMFLSTGYKSRGFASFVTPCATAPAGTVGRQTAAEWLRAGFHDMATTNTFFTPYGGIDASLAYELNDGENIGAGFNTTFLTYSGFFNSRLPASDLVALGVYASVRACGGPIIPMRGGRKDATAAGPIGVPQPQNAIGTFTNQFARMGFNETEMIQMTACGHTLGGVHAGDFSNIVTPGTVPNDFQLFDNTVEFDNNIATRYISGPDTDPLAVGPSVTSKRNSDLVVFNADQNVTLQAMTNPATFNSMCTTILQKMIETVDPAVVLSDIIQPYEVKPTGLQLTLLSGGTQLQFTGDIRVRTTVRSASQIASVQLTYEDRNGVAVISPIVAAAGGTTQGFDDSFSFYSFSSNLPVDSSISSFTVLINLVSGSTETHDNNGAGYPVSDAVIVQTPQSCLSNGNLTVVAAIRSTVTTPVNMTVTQKVKVASGSPIPSPLAALVSVSLAMVPGSSYGPYNLYSASYSVSSAVGTKYGVVSGASSDTFKDPADLGTTCQTSGAVLNSTSSTVSSTSSSSSVVSSTITSSSSTPTPSIQQTVGAYTFQGCYTEATNERALSGASFYDYTRMTLEQCASDCTGFTYWGVEYGGECYCGNRLGPGSVLAAPGDCSFVCPGNSSEYCGAGERLDMYMLSALATASSISSSSITSSPTATPTLHIVQSAGLYDYYGCYTEGTGRALSEAFYPSDWQSIEQCVTNCSPYLYAGAEYGRECWCADSFGAGSVLAPDSDCSMTCSGNQYEYCGAGNQLSVYIRNGTQSAPSSSSSTSPSSSSPTQTTPAIKPTVGNYKYYGCQTEATNMRALSAASAINYKYMTLESCEAICAGYLYWGVEYGGECYCGNSFNAGSVNATDSDCSFLCPGNNLEFCGAGDRLSTYYKA